MRGALDLRDSSVVHALLGRPSRDLLDDADRASHRGTRILITGAGGSVGSELARQLTALSPGALVLVDHSEYALFRAEQDLKERFPDAPVVPVLADVTRSEQIHRIVAGARPDVVFHAAAYKHVLMMERDVVSALRANVLGSVYVARACQSARARLVLISSDKAANAKSVMGASKRMAELAVLAEARQDDRVAIVRFGNILGSSGSVLELMVDRVRRGQPLQVTDPEASRYFMSSAEAVGLVLKADRVARTGQILWLEMGEPIGIVDLAHRLLALARTAGMSDVPIEFIGLRPGEKLREELTVQGLELLATGQQGVWVARQLPIDTGRIRHVVRQAEAAVARDNAARALQVLCEAVPEYEPSPRAGKAAGQDAGARMLPPAHATKADAPAQSVGGPTTPAAPATA
jgi:O-antigen biosynthesis protein WbqV